MDDIKLPDDSAIVGLIDDCLASLRNEGLPIPNVSVGVLPIIAILEAIFKLIHLIQEHSESE